jgi:hypothetical protein
MECMFRAKKVTVSISGTLLIQPVCNQDYFSPWKVPHAMKCFHTVQTNSTHGGGSLSALLAFMRLQVPLHSLHSLLPSDSVTVTVIRSTECCYVTEQLCH